LKFHFFDEGHVLAAKPI